MKMKKLSQTLLTNNDSPKKKKLQKTQPPFHTGNAQLISNSARVNFFKFPFPRPPITKWLGKRDLYSIETVRPAPYIYFSHSFVHLSSQSS